MRSGRPGLPSRAEQRLDRDAAGADHDLARRRAAEPLLVPGLEPGLADLVAGCTRPAELLELLGRRRPDRAEQRPRELAALRERGLVVDGERPGTAFSASLTGS